MVGSLARFTDGLQRLLNEVKPLQCRALFRGRLEGQQRFNWTLDCYPALVVKIAPTMDRAEKGRKLLRLKHPRKVSEDSRVVKAKYRIPLGLASQRDGATERGHQTLGALFSLKER